MSSLLHPAAGALPAAHPLNEWLRAGSTRETGRSRDFLLTTKWRLLVNGNPVMEEPRHIVLRDTLNHLAHHRGQLTVYLRLTDRIAPSIYGPTADDQRFL